MNILVTGGAGFIGSNLCESLLKKGHNVFCIDNFNSYYDPKIKENNIKTCLKDKNFRLFRKDICDFGGLEGIFDKISIDAVFHLAAEVGVRASIENPKLFEKVNVAGTLNILEICRKFGIKKLIFASSSSVYGENKKTPFSETDPVDNMISPYAASKRSAEIFCGAYSRLYGIKIACMRLFTVYGPRGRPEMAPYKFTKLVYEGKEIPMFGNGHSKRDYTYVTDIIDGLMAALDKDFDFEIINLGDSRPIELKKLISVISMVVGKDPKIKQLPEQKGDVSVTFADISKAKKLLDYKPKIALEQGMKNFFAWYKNNML
ncbi:GDP-mannose 4,6-dehydratase [Candidatus Woesearchaeota archaeon]|nr:GDP-mannose 4,6-dehydratase [Candidatus Woesearchaeota archaeon]